MKDLFLDFESNLPRTTSLAPCHVKPLHILSFLFFPVVQMGEEYYHAKDYTKALK